MDDWASNKLPERLPFSKKRLPKRVIFSYILDYIIIVALIGIFYIVDKIPPFYQPFSINNYTLHYPFAERERINVFELCVISVGAPAVIIAFYTLVIDGIFSHQTPMPANRSGIKRLTGRYRLKDRLWELNCGILGLGLAVCFAFTMTGALKNAIGKPRPDLIARCVVPENYQEDRLKLTTVETCSVPRDAKLRDGFKSFPSGHSSVAFAGMFYLSLYLAAKLHIMDSKGEVWKAFIVLVPSLGAALVAGSRIMDARHHPFDVLSGSAMGILVGWGAYRQYFPPISETWRKGRAYPIRSWGQGPQPPRIQVEEDVEPLRTIARPADEESGTASGFVPQPPIDGNEHGGNVFRQQISQSQRRRHDEGQFGGAGVQHSNTIGSQYSRSDTLGSSVSTKVARYQGQMPAPSPFAVEASRSRRHDNYDYSSSEDEDNYELQQTYTLSAPQSGGVYNPVQGTFTDTGYHPPPGISPNPTPPPPLHAVTTPGVASTMSPVTGDIGDQRRDVAPVPPPHAAGTTPQQI
ncbi:lipid phosphate phosphatase 1 [Corynespora cassiicola Philippines]|uniref:Lipid phosphate phosphatase 1 n=1 Tax=Corynespora cassiicola Philippines TaxID=1448308 RepID=A0A2T2NXP3_CORCC|nr:lipid phosphate phosphatase 1 [Corynespora cassiicola Philippines]